MRRRPRPPSPPPTTAARRATTRPGTPLLRAGPDLHREVLARCSAVGQRPGQAAGRHDRRRVGHPPGARPRRPAEIKSDVDRAWPTAQGGAAAALPEEQLRPRPRRRRASRRQAAGCPARARRPLAKPEPRTPGPTARVGRAGRRGRERRPPPLAARRRARRCSCPASGTPCRPGWRADAGFEVAVPVRLRHRGHASWACPTSAT